MHNTTLKIMRSGRACCHVVGPGHGHGRPAAAWFLEGALGVWAGVGVKIFVAVWRHAGRMDLERLYVVAGRMVHGVAWRGMDLEDPWPAA